MSLSESFVAECAASADTMGDKHRREIESLGLDPERSRAMAEVVQAAIEGTAGLMLRAEDIGGRAAMDLFVAQVNESLVEMARLVAKTEAP